jgi:hypothetical protein
MLIAAGYPLPAWSLGHLTAALAVPSEFGGLGGDEDGEIAGPLLVAP